MPKIPQYNNEFWFQKTKKTFTHIVPVMSHDETPQTTKNRTLSTKWYLKFDCHLLRHEY